MFYHLLNTNYHLVPVKMLRRQVRIVSRRKRRVYLQFLWWQLQIHIREIWIHPLNEDRIEKGEFYNLYPDLQHYPVKFFKFYWMSVSKFDFLLTKLAPRLRKKATNLRLPISPEQMFVLTLR